jgi:hypothetical protein
MRGASLLELLGIALTDVISKGRLPSEAVLKALISKVRYLQGHFQVAMPLDVN